jgi:hypothetical protein
MKLTALSKLGIFNKEEQIKVWGNISKKLAEEVFAVSRFYNGYKNLIQMLNL